MSILDIVLLGLVVLAAVLAVRSLRRRRSSCGCGCAGCAKACGKAQDGKIAREGDRAPVPDAHGQTAWKPPRA